VCGGAPSAVSRINSNNSSVDPTYRYSDLLVLANAAGGHR
jgi:hypothetical protein